MSAIHHISPSDAPQTWEERAEKLADEIVTNVPDLAGEMIMEFAKAYAANASGWSSLSKQLTETSKKLGY